MHVFLGLSQWGLCFGCAMDVPQVRVCYEGAVLGQLRTCLPSARTAMQSTNSGTE